MLLAIVLTAQIIIRYTCTKASSLYKVILQQIKSKICVILQIENKNMSNSEPIIIPFNKTKLIKLLLASVLFTAAGIWLLAAKPDLSGTMFRNPIVVTTAAIICILFFSFAGSVFINRLRSKKPALIIDETGITNYVSNISGTHIPWRDIRYIVTNKVFNQLFLMVLLYNPEDYLSKETNLIKRKLLIMNYKQYGSPVSIAVSTVQGNINELRRLLQDQLSKYTAHTK